MSVVSHCIHNKWYLGDGEPMTAINPATGEPSWRGCAATQEEVDRAVFFAREAFGEWRGTPLNTRLDVARKFADTLKKNEADLIESICVSTG